MTEAYTLTLDEQVAVEILGWIVFKDGVHAQPQWTFGTDIGQAFVIVQEMERRGWIFTLQGYRGRWYCQFSSHEIFEIHRLADAEVGKTAPEAICRAALAAVRSLK